MKIATLFHFQFLLGLLLSFLGALLTAIGYSLGLGKPVTQLTVILPSVFMVMIAVPLEYIGIYLMYQRTQAWWVIELPYATFYYFTSLLIIKRFLIRQPITLREMIAVIVLIILTLFVSRR